MGSTVTPCGYSLWAVWSHHVVQPVGSMVTSCGTACGQYGHTMWLKPVGSMDTPCGTACGQYGNTLWYSLWAVWSHHVVQPVGSMVTPCGTACGQYGHTVSKFNPTIRVDNSSSPPPNPDRSAPAMVTPVHMASILEERAIYRKGCLRATKSWHCRFHLLTPLHVHSCAEHHLHRSAHVHIIANPKLKKLVNYYTTSVV